MLEHDAVAVRIAESPPFDVLVNNADVNRPMPMQAVARGLIAAGRPGSLIHIGSQMGHVGGRERSLYCASKWAVEGMSKACALDLAPFGIRFNTIAPTFIETSLTQGFLARRLRGERVAEDQAGPVGHSGRHHGRGHLSGERGLVAGYREDRTDAEYLTLIEQHVAALNHALRNIPAERVRMHVCWGNYEGPHNCDVELGAILPTLMHAKPLGPLYERVSDLGAGRQEQ